MAFEKTPRLKRFQWIAMGFLLITGLINYADRSALSIANGNIRTELHLSPLQMGYLLSAFSFAYAFSQLPVGALLDRFGSRLMLGLGMAFWSFGQMLGGVVHGLTQFVIVRAMLGLGEAPQFPGGAKVVSEWFNRAERGTPTGVFVASSCISPCLAPPILTAIMLAIGWRWMFILTGAIGIIAAIGWVLIYRNRAEVDLTQTEIGHLDAGSDMTAGDARITGAEWRELFTHRTTWGMILGFMGVIYMVWLFLTWLPAYLEHERGLTIARTGWVVAIPYIFGTFGMLASGLLADGLLKRGLSTVASRKWPVCGGLIGAAIFTVPAAYTPSTVMAIVYICGAMFFINMASGGAWTLVSVIVPKRKAASLGSIMNFGGYFAGSFAPIITGWIVQHTNSYVNALLASAVIAALAAIAYLVLVRQPPSREQRHDRLAALPH